MTAQQGNASTALPAASWSAALTHPSTDHAPVWA